MLKSGQEIKIAQQKHRKLQSQMERYILYASLNYWTAAYYMLTHRLNKEILVKKHEVKLLCEKLLTDKQDFTVNRL